MTPEAGDMAAYLAVVEQGSFGRAAGSLLVSQPTVSDRIARLERAVGAALFERTARGASLTPAGARLLPYVERATALLDEAVAAARAVERPPPLRVAVHVTFAHRAVPLVLGALGEPAGTVVVRDAHSDEIVAMLLDGVVDLGFVLPGARPPSLRFVALPADPVVAVVAAGDPLAARSSVPLGALAGRRVALNRWGDGAAAFLDRLAAAGVTEDRWTECSDGLTALLLARDHDHVALVTRSLAGPDLAAGRLVRLPLRPAPRWRVPVALAYRSRDHDRDPLPAVRAALATRPI